MSLLQRETRTAFSGEAADGNISSGMFVCSCISGVRLRLLWLLGGKVFSFWSGVSIKA
ncbi:hypothetical protein [Desulfobacula sp.]|uniref:hypothetical protein n=1 Tax=Desulfobacula sp. TaxID=2593537 RepID=UPI001EC2E904|nr:hypothetical protein [Desulfobacula sp.]